MIDLTVLQAKVAAGQITAIEMLEIIANQNSEIQELKAIKVTNPIIGETLEDLYAYLDNECNEQFNVHVIFDFFQFLIEKVFDSTNYKADSSYLNEKWGFLPLEEVLKALSVFRRKGANSFPMKGECDRGTKVTLPNGDKGLMSEFMVYSLQDKANAVSAETIENVKEDLAKGLNSGEITPDDYLVKSLAVEDLTKTKVSKPKNAKLDDL